MGFEVDIEVSLDTNSIPFTIYKTFDNFDDACGYRHYMMNELREIMKQENELFNYEERFIVRSKCIVKVRSKLINLSTSEEIL